MQIDVAVNPAVCRMPVRAVPGEIGEGNLRHVYFERESIVRHHRQNIGWAAEFQMGCEIESERNEAGAVCSERYAIQIYLGNLPHCLELDVDALAFE